MNYNLKQKQLDKELVSYNPLKWAINLPFINYTVRVEDIVPALSGAIGKVALVAAFAMAWAKGLGISDPTFVTENVRLEIVFGSIATILFSVILNPYAAPPGTLAPLIPVVPIMISAGVHPLPMGLLVGIIGLIISGFKYFDKILEINGTGTKGGIILLFGLLGIISSVENLKRWALTNNSALIYSLLLIFGLITYIILGRFGYKWLMIPLVALAAIFLSSLFGFFPNIKTTIAMPLINPSLWWNEKWGIGYGLTLRNFIKAFPFALLAIVMWPTDALAIRTLQEANYPENAKSSIFDMTSTFIAVSIRNIGGALLGGAQTSAIWRSFMIPLSIVKRPIGGSALLLGVFGIIFGILGFPLDIAVFPPLIWLVLIFGVFIPLVEIGLNTIKTAHQAQIAGICLVAGIAINPVIGWTTAVLVENLNLLGGARTTAEERPSNVKITIIVVAVTIISYVVSNLLR